jgi:hypothetical protein
MRNYDWDFGFGFGSREPAHPRRPREYDYDSGLRRGRDLHAGRPPEFEGPRRRPMGHGGRTASYGGGYAGSHPSFGGVPGGREEGMYYGGGSGESGRGPRTGPSGFGWRTESRGYDRAMRSRDDLTPDRLPGRFEREEETFLPESAYRRNPGLNRTPGAGARGAGSGMQFGREGHAQDDDTILHSVRQNLYQDRYLDADALEVDVEDAVVTLRGEVADFLEARYAWDDAWEVPGVRGVLNQITVRTDRP